MKSLLLCILCFLSMCSSYKMKEGVEFRPDWSKTEDSSSKFVVSSQSERASKAAIEIVKKGGNVVDAFVTTSFMLAVEMPEATGLGGGGFLLFRHAPTKKIMALDFREVAPAKAHSKMFQDSNANVLKEASKTGANAVGVPGFVAGVLEIHNLYGKLTREEVLEPAIQLAEKGFPVSKSLAGSLKENEDRLKQFRGSRALFFKEDKILTEGDLFVQKDLANTIRSVAQKGRDGFYKGDIAWSIVIYLHKNEGLHTISDFVRYRPKMRKPIVGEFNGYQVYGMPPPSSGGILVQQMLNVLEADDLGDRGPFGISNVQATIGAMQLAFSERAKYFGDGDFVKIPTDTLLSKSFAAELGKRRNPNKALTAKEISSLAQTPKESDHTTHFSMADADGNVIASTQTINGTFGSAMVVPGTGVLLNNEMDDFSAKPGDLNMFGAVGSQANEVVGRKRPLSSMSPTIVMKDAEPRFALGSPNGTRIISCVTLSLLNLLAYGQSLEDAISAPRYHHQWMPDELWVEPHFPQATRVNLEQLGYKVEEKSWGCRVQGVSLRGSRLKAVADPRGSAGSAMGL